MKYLSAIFIFFALFTLAGRVPAQSGNTAYTDFLLAALKEMERGSYFNANQMINAAFEQRRDERLAYIVKAICYAQAGLYADAQKAFDEAKMMNADDDICCWGKALCRLGLGDFAGAGMFLNAVKSNHLKPEAALLNRYINALSGRTVVDAGDERDKAIQAYLLMKQGNFDRAANILKQFSAASVLGPQLDHGFSLAFDNIQPLLPMMSSGKSTKLMGHGSETAAAAFSGSVRLKANIHKNPEIRVVMFYVNDRLVGIVNNPPYEISWDTTKHSNGIHTVKIRGEDINGVTISELTNNVLVVNSVPSPGKQEKGVAAQKVENAILDALKLRISRTWAEYQLALTLENSGQQKSAALGYAKILSFAPYYRDAGSRWKNIVKPSSRQPVWKTSQGTSRVALSFDDGPNDGTPALLDELKRLKIKSTFFLVGSQVRQYPELVMRIQSDGHELASHTENHLSLVNLDDEDIVKELFGPIAAIQDITGVIPLLFRPPGGNLDERSSRIARNYGLTPIMWSVNAGRYEGGSPRTMQEYVASNLKDGSIVLLHNCEPTTLAALEGVLSEISRKGLKPSVVGDMLR